MSVAGFGISSAESSGSGTRVLVKL